MAGALDLALKAWRERIALGESWREVGAASAEIAGKGFAVASGERDAFAFVASTVATAMAISVAVLFGLAAASTLAASLS